MEWDQSCTEEWNNNKIAEPIYQYVSSYGEAREDKNISINIILISPIKIYFISNSVNFK